MHIHTDLEIHFKNHQTGSRPRTTRYVHEAAAVIQQCTHNRAPNSNNDDSSNVLLCAPLDAGTLVPHVRRQLVVTADVEEVDQLDATSATKTMPYTV